MNELNTTVANERQRIFELACIDERRFWTEMRVVFTKFCEREQEEVSDSFRFAIRAVVTSKDSPPIPESEWYAVLKDGRKLTFLCRNSTDTRMFKDVFSDYASAAGHVIHKWRHEIEFYSNHGSKWLCALFLSEKRTEDHTWERPLLTSLEEVEKLIAGEQLTPEPSESEKPEANGDVSGDDHRSGTISRRRVAQWEVSFYR